MSQEDKSGSTPDSVKLENAIHLLLRTQPFDERRSNS